MWKFGRLNCILQITCKRAYSQCHYSKLVRLKQRGCVRVKGDGAGTFLQGLLTNDISVHQKCSYSLMLNVQGRILFDVLVYALSSETDFLLECDHELSAELVKTMKRYRLRKKIDIYDAATEYDIHALFQPQPTISTQREGVDLTFTPLNDVIIDIPDPRLKDLGRRIITVKGAKIDLVDVQMSEDLAPYNKLRYQLGVGEGPLDHPPGSALPLECNAEFLNGVSFSKGCYIGQELTARTHHTGVIRKRLMPVKLPSATVHIPANSSIKTNTGKDCGKFRSHCEQYGLALLRLEQAVGEKEVFVTYENSSIGLSCHIPHWWLKDTDEIIKQVIKQNVASIES